MYYHRILLLLIPAIYMVVPSLIDGWSSLKPAWYAAYVVWALLIVLAYVIQRRRHHV